MNDALFDCSVYDWVYSCLVVLLVYLSGKNETDSLSKQAKLAAFVGIETILGSLFFKHWRGLGIGCED